MKKKKAAGSCAVVIMMCVCMTLFYVAVCSQKADFHTDELYTFQLANSKWGPWFYMPEKEYFSPDLIRQQLVVQPDDTFNYQGVMERESFDRHPFLYALFMHTLCSFFPGEFSWWVGLAVNVLFAVLGVFVIFLCMRQLTKRFAVAVGTAVFYGITYGMVQEVTFIRSYVILMFLTALILYIHLKYWEEPFQLQFYALLGVTSLCGALIHYYFIVFLFGCCVVYFFKLTGHKKYKEAMAYFATEAAAGLLAVIIFPRMITTMFAPAVTANVQKVSLSGHFQIFLGMVHRELSGGLIWIWCLVLMVLLFGSIYKRKKSSAKIHLQNIDIEKIIFLIFPVILCIAVVSVSAELVTSRYVCEVYPAVVLLWSYVTYFVLDGVFEKKNIVYLIMLVAGALFIGKSYWHNNVTSLYRDRTDILSQTERRINRNALLLNKNGCIWTIPSAYSELKDYRSLMIYPYNEIETGELEGILSDYDQDALNVYCYSWDMDEEEYNQCCGSLWRYLHETSPQVKIEKLWDSYYCEVFEISGL